MITLGLDPHPSTHTVVALDEHGASLGHLTVPNTPEGLIRLHQFGARFSSRRWAVEGAGNHFIAAFVAELLAGSESVFSIPPSLTSQYRARRGRKKSDVIDAENVARALLANPQLPQLHAVDLSFRTVAHDITNGRAEPAFDGARECAFPLSSAAIQQKDPGPPNVASPILVEV